MHFIITNRFGVIRNSEANTGFGGVGESNGEASRCTSGKCQYTTFRYNATRMYTISTTVVVCRLIQVVAVEKVGVVHAVHEMHRAIVY